MLYSIRYIPASRQEEIKKEWENLESGKEMTLFQSYNWYKMLSNCYIPTDTYYYESIFAVVYLGIECILIAPLWIIKHNFKILNKKGVYFLGRDGFSDYLNVIYNKFDTSAFDTLIADLRRKYHVNYFYFEELMESSSTYKYIIKSAKKIYRDEREPYISLEAPTSIDAYNALLSKHSRQNLRTARNRLEKDGKELLFSFNDTYVNKERCLEIRESKLSINYARFSWYKIHKYRLANKIRFRFPRYNPLLSYHSSKIMTAYIEEDICAFFNYAFDDLHKSIILFSAGTNLEYARYSPGMLLMYNFIKDIIEKKQYNLIDFTRGNEMYKKALGGSEKYLHNMRLSFR